MLIYKIRNKLTGLFSSGKIVDAKPGCGEPGIPVWTKQGKTWNQKQHIREHMKFCKYDENAEICIFQMVEFNILPINEFV